MPWRGEGGPGDVEPAGAGEELVGVLPVFEEVHEFCELRRIFRTDVGSLADQVLGVTNAPYSTIDRLATET